jgi:lysophospholipase L1-like esterase
MKRIPLKRIFLCVVIAIMVSEVSFRLYYLIAGKNISSIYSNYVIKDNYWLLRPNQTFIQPERYGDIIYSSNRDGFRDINHDYLSQNYRILFLGDSVTFGLGVKQNHIFTNLLEHKLNEKSKIKYETINESICSYGPGQELHVLKDIGLKYHPKFIILVFFNADFERCVPPKKPSIVNYYIALHNIIVNRSISYMRLRQLIDMFNYQLFHNIRRQYFRNTLNDQPLQDTRNYLNNRSDNDVCAFTLIKAMKAEALKNNIQFLVLISPLEVQLYKTDFDILDQRIYNFCRENAIDFADPLSEMRLDPKKETLFSDGLHFSKYGHKFIADYLFKQLQNGYLNAPCCSPTLIY